MGSRVQMDRLYLERIGPQRVSGELLFHPRFLRIPCYDSLMRHLVVLLIHFLATLVRLLGPGGVRSIVASMVGSKAANGGQVKTGQRMWPGTQDVLPCRSHISQA